MDTKKPYRNQKKKKFYGKGIGVLPVITSGNIKKERLNLKELVKGNK